ncbi:DUF58 domain-containing protein [Thermococcus sibiricus]|uniref:DUF58 domain containing protein n=1 Tax=Thermococcus sibiricus TaxID=172049 RepID=A0A101EKY2_9EURY|nr:DUF58 domain-containing protein [Thermococcus sibiricus]KUK17277.1 MAG: DUF58 domain containing protein [Thermococcus sibiricus]KUK28036.1 MAG: DUF58 domain containing protein [Thermococcus sp. 40_45]
MKREDFIAILSLLLILEGYLGDNLVPALLGFSIGVYLFMLRSKANFDIKGERVIEEKGLEENKSEKVILKLENRGENAFVRIEEQTNDFEVSGVSPFLLESGDLREFFYYLTPRYKGEFSLRPAKVIAEDERGLYFEEFEIGREEKIFVYPSVDSIKEAARADYNIRLAELYKKSQFIGTEGIEIKDLREYQHGDDFKRIDWKASARLGELIIREMLKESDADVYIFVDNTSEMRKGIRMAKVDYASTLALQLAATLIKSYRVGMVIYDEEKAEFIKASKSMAHLENMRRKLNLRWKKGVMSLRAKLEVKLSRKGRDFLNKILPLKKGRRGSKGIFEGLSLIKMPSFLIFISDLNNPSDLYKAIAQAKWNHKVLLLSPNPVLFYGGELDRETLKRLYRAYLEREKILRRFNALTPTIDLGPSDYIREIAKVV